MFKGTINISKRVIMFAMMLSFSLGFAVSRVLNQFEKDLSIEGKWITIWAGHTSSIQLNVSTLEIDDSLITTWIREDRQADFAGQTGVVGRTIISKVTLDCAKRTVAVHEQKSFTQFLDETQHTKLQAIPLPPLDLMSALSTILICGSDPNPKLNNLPKQQFILI